MSCSAHRKCQTELTYVESVDLKILFAVRTETPALIAVHVRLAWAANSLGPEVVSTN